MQFLKRVWDKQKEITINYLKNTPIYISAKNFIIPIILIIGGAWSFISQSPYVLIYFLLVIVAILAVSVYYMSSHYVDIKKLYFEEDISLIDILTHIEEVKRLKKTKDINHVNVSQLTVNFFINKTDNADQSDLDVTWDVDCVVVDKEICDYHMIYSKSDSKRKASPIVTINSGNKKYNPNISETNTGIYNYFLAALKPGKLKVNTYFHVTIQLNNYFRFVWKDFEALMVNTNLYGKSVDKLDIALSFNDERISKTIISIYEVNPDNLQKKFIQHLNHTEKKGKHIFSFHSDKIKPGSFYLITIPRST